MRCLGSREILRRLGDGPSLSELVAESIPSGVGEPLCEVCCDAGGEGYGGARCSRGGKPIGGSGELGGELRGEEGTLESGDEGALDSSSVWSAMLGRCDAGRSRAARNGRRGGRMRRGRGGRGGRPERSIACRQWQAGGYRDGVGTQSTPVQCVGGVVGGWHAVEVRRWEVEVSSSGSACACCDRLSASKQSHSGPLPPRLWMYQLPSSQDQSEARPAFIDS